MSTPRHARARMKTITRPVKVSRWGSTEGVKMIGTEALTAGTREMVASAQVRGKIGGGKEKGAQSLDSLLRGES